MSFEGIRDFNLEDDIKKIEYKNLELNKNLSEIYNLKKELEKKYTSPVKQDEIDFNLKNKIDTLRENRNRVSLLLKKALDVHLKAKNETELIIQKVDTKIDTKVNTKIEIK